MNDDSKRIFRYYPELFSEYASDIFDKWMKWYGNLLLLLVCIAIVSLLAHILFKVFGDTVTYLTIAGALIFVGFIKD